MDEDTGELFDTLPSRKKVDRFHIVQHLNRAFDGVRKQIMKQLNKKDLSQAKYYRQLKSLYRLFLKPEERLDFTTFKKWQKFQWSYLMKK